MDDEERKFANELHYAVKGFLIHPHYPDETVRQIKDSYLKRLWETMKDWFIVEKALKKHGQNV